MKNDFMKQIIYSKIDKNKENFDEFELAKI